MPAWDKATNEELQNYRASLHHKLMDLKCPESLHQCKDSKCELLSHDKERDNLVLDVLCAMVETSYTCLPLTGRAEGLFKVAMEGDVNLF